MTSTDRDRAPRGCTDDHDRGTPPFRWPLRRPVPSRRPRTARPDVGTG